MNVLTWNSEAPPAEPQHLFDPPLNTGDFPLTSAAWKFSDTLPPVKSDEESVREAIAEYQRAKERQLRKTSGSSEGYITIRSFRPNTTPVKSKVSQLHTAACESSSNMPAFFSRNMPSSPMASYPTYSSMTYNAQHSAHRTDYPTGLSEKHTQYKGPNPSAPMFQPQQQQQSLPTYDSYTQRRQEPLVLPSIHTYDQKMWASRITEPEVKAQEEPAAGGLVKHLDYDLGFMTDYLFDTTLSIVKSSRQTPTDYREWMRHVLSATRLPSTTIFIALNNLVKRMELLKPKSDPRHSLYSHSALGQEVYDVDPKRMFIVALIISSKYADDSTFINRSWAEVAKMDVRLINELERDWLREIQWNLDVKIDEREGRGGWEAWYFHWKDYERNRRELDSMRNAYNSKPSPPFAKLSPINTNIPKSGHSLRSMDSRQLSSLRADAFSYKPSEPYRDVYSSTSSAGYSDSYPWNPPRTSIDNSPDSAPYTGPTTPEYYSQGTMAWGQPHTGTRYDQQRAMTVFPSQWAHPQQAHRPAHQYLPSYYNSGKPEEYSYPPDPWNSSNYSGYHQGHCTQYPYPPPGLPQPTSYYPQAVVG
jgi:Cyclin, N-terminal domain